MADRNSKDRSRNVNRRFFIGGMTAAGVALTSACSTGSKGAKVKFKSPNEKLNIAAIGAGGKGRQDIRECCAPTSGVDETGLGENCVALCDPDWDRAADSFEKFPKARRYKDYRVMLEEMGDQIDALTITTPDHTHAPAAYMAMMMGKHVYVQKPLTHTVAEARLLTNVAKSTGVATQMGNQGHCGDGVRELCEMVWGGAIGQVKEAHIWTSRPVWPQGMTEPLKSEAVPDTMNWDLWIGSAPWRPYNHNYAPFKWRGWLDFGAGALGDMACHIMDPVYWSLNLKEADEFSVELVSQEGRNEQTFPKSTIVKYSFPARKTPQGEMGAVDVYWYDGDFSDKNGPKGKDFGFPDEKLGDGGNGSVFVGANGTITTGEYGGKTRLLPSDQMKDYSYPDQVIPRIKGENPYYDWIQACKGGTPACSNFSYSGPFTEMVNFGNLAVKTGEKLVWDNRNGIVKNVDNPEQIVSKEYRPGWEIPVPSAARSRMS